MKGRGLRRDALSWAKPLKYELRDYTSKVKFFKASEIICLTTHGTEEKNTHAQINWNSAVCKSLWDSVSHKWWMKPWQKYFEMTKFFGNCTASGRLKILI